MSNKIKALLLAALLTFVFAACGGEPRPRPDPTPTPQPTPQSVVQVTDDLDALFAAALDYLAEDEEADTSQKISNVILKATSYEIISANESSCTLKVLYPDFSALVRKVAENTEKLTDDNIESTLAEVLTLAENNEFEITEDYFEVAVEKSADGTYGIVWTDELLNAFTGGLYSNE